MEGLFDKIWNFFVEILECFLLNGVPFRREALIFNFDINNLINYDQK